MHLNYQLKNERGLALVTVLFTVTVLSAMMGAYFTSTRLASKISLATNYSSKGFYSAEAGLGARADQIRSTFQGRNLPTGTSPNRTNACRDGNVGAGDFRCQTYNFNNREVNTYVEDLSGGTPSIVPIPLGEPFGGLSALEYRYDLRSESVNVSQNTDSILGLRMKSRLIPAFQFAAFSNDDLEIYPFPQMTLNGPVHTNSTLFLSSRAGLSMSGPVSASKEIIRGQKANVECANRESWVEVDNPRTPFRLRACNGAALSEADVAGANGNLLFEVPALDLPPLGSIELGKDSGAEADYWNGADFRIVLELDASGAPDTSNHPTGIVVKNLNDSINVNATNRLHGASCSNLDVHYLATPAPGSPVAYQKTLRDRQRADDVNGIDINTLEVDMRVLLTCLHNENLITGGIEEETDNGLVIYFGIDGPDRLTFNDYGVRITNAKVLRALGGGPQPKGLTVASNQPIFLWRDYNSPDPAETNADDIGVKIPASAVTDRIYKLSNNWTDAVGQSRNRPEDRVATATSYSLAVVSGIHITGNANWPAAGTGPRIFEHNGGLQNFFAYNEDWNGTHTYLGSMVSFGPPLKNNYRLSFAAFRAPVRDWAFDEDFLNFEKLPPLSPVLVYLRQELFTRYFEQDI